jgi:hypothetical protein
MLDHELASAILALLRNKAELAALNGFTSQDDETHKLPAITVSAQSEPLAGSASVFRATVAIMIESDARDDSPEQHASRVAVLRAVLADKADFVSGVNSGGTVHLHGFAIAATDPGFEATRFRTPVTLKAGYSVP